jgi:hypothetical protein
MVCPDRRRTDIVTTWILLLSCLLAGCSGAPSADDLAAIRGGNAAMVLIRLVCGDPHREGNQLLNSRGDLLNINSGFGFRDFEEGGRLRHLSSVDNPVRALSDSAWAEGWVAIIRSPGYHYLTFSITNTFIVQADTHQEPLYRIEVPARTPVIYAGTFHDTSCGGTSSGTKNLINFGRRPQALLIEDEREAAAAVVRRDVSVLPSPVTRLAVLQTGPILLGVPPTVSPQ